MYRKHGGRPSCPADLRAVGGLAQNHRATGARGARCPTAIPSMTRVPATEKGLTIGDFLVPVRVGERTSPGSGHRAADRRRRDPRSTCAPWCRSRSRATRCRITLQNFGVLVVGGALGLPARRRGGRCCTCAGRHRPAVLRRGQGRAPVILRARRAAISSGSSSPRRSSGGSRSWAGTAGSAARSARRPSARGDLRDRRAMARGHDSGSSLPGRSRSGLLPFLVVRHRQAPRRGRGVPGGVVGGRPAAERPLT